MDPFSIVVGTATFVEIAVRTTKFIDRFCKEAPFALSEGQTFAREVAAVQSIHKSLEAAFTARPQPRDTQERDHADQLWQNVRTNLKGCESHVAALEAFLRKVLGAGDQGDVSKSEEPDASSTRHRLKLQWRLQTNRHELDRLRQRLALDRNTLQMLFAAIGLLYEEKSQASNKHVSELITDLKTTIKETRKLQQDAPEDNKRDVGATIDSTEAVVSYASINKHFLTPRSVSSLYVGREKQLQLLKSAFLPSRSREGSKVQKRFIIYGIGGSGKTQFSCKYAQENQECYYGVFFLDVSQGDSRQQTLAQIAKIAGVDANLAAVQNWLSQLDQPWLLLIDNADSDDIDLDSLFPHGGRGHVLVTTRRPTLKTYGNVGSKWFHFWELESAAANDLLLSEAGQSKPWDTSKESCARIINTELGCLPLAVVLAGRTILSGLATLQDFLPFYKNSRRRVLRARRSRERLKTPSGFIPNEERGLNVYSTFEGLYSGLVKDKSQDALDAVCLLHIFSFLYRDNIRYDMLVQAAKNPGLEKAEREKDKKSTGSKIAEANSGKWWLLDTNRGPPDLPLLLRDTEELPFDEDQLKRALKKLVDMSLVIQNAANNSYSIHPLVHKCIRERPDLKARDQALWCGMAAQLLANCILLPPLGTAEADEALRRDLLPHINHVRTCQAEIAKQFQDNWLEARAKSWQWGRVLLPAPMKQQLTQRRAIQLARYGVVYLQWCMWEEAETLLRTVLPFFVSYLGAAHQVSVRVHLVLAEVYWQMGRGHDAATLQERLLLACERNIGRSAPRTLEVVDKLGVTRWQQGRYKEAKKLHQRAIDGFTAACGPEHADTLRAVDHSGRVEFKYFRYTEALELHRRAWCGLKVALGPSHLDTLVTADNLAMTLLYLREQGPPAGSKDAEAARISEAENLERDVWKQRGAKLGREHPFTLWAQCNLARIIAARQGFDEADTLIQTGLEVATRNLGPEHIGTLYGRMYAGRLLLQRGRLEQAEAELRSVSAAQKRLAVAAGQNDYPDRLQTLFHLVECLRAQGGREREAQDVCDEAMQGLSSIGGDEHPLMVLLAKTKAEIQEEAELRSIDQPVKADKREVIIEGLAHDNGWGPTDAATVGQIRMRRQRLSDVSDDTLVNVDSEENEQDARSAFRKAIGFNLPSPTRDSQDETAAVGRQLN